MNTLVDKVLQQERTGVISGGGQPRTLVGNEVREGDKAPDFTAVDTGLNRVRLGDFLGKTVIISVIPSIDTPVCDRQTKRFAQEAKNVDPDVVILTISQDLPFAQKRWAKVHEIEGITFLSDYWEHEFGLKYGLFIKETHLLARSVLIVDRNGIVKYRQIVADQDQEPNYDLVIEQLGRLTSE